VVLETLGPEVYIGRFDTQDEKGVHLIGVSILDQRAEMEEFVARTLKFGVRVDRPHLLVPNDQVKTVKPLGSISV